MPEISDNQPPVIKEPSSEVEVGECFAPFVPKTSAAPALKAKPAPLVSFCERAYRDSGYPLPKKSEILLPHVAESAGDPDTSVTEHIEVRITTVQVPPPPPRKATALEIFTWIKRSLLAQTHLPEATAELVSFWVISTWFQDVLLVRPCLVITGSAHQAIVLLRVLNGLCRKPVLVAGFRKSDLPTLSRSCYTALVSEPNLSNRDAALLGTLSNSGFLVVADGRLADYSMSRAVYAGENATTRKIENSIRCHIRDTHAATPVLPEWLEKTTERLLVHLNQYREKNLAQVKRRTYTPFVVSSETAAIATPLVRCIVDASELQKKIVTLLHTEDQWRLAEVSDSIEAVVLEAALALSRDGRKQAYAREIAANVNILLEARGEVARLSPANICHWLEKLGLRTRKLSQSGDGVNFSKGTVTEIQRLAGVYGMEVVSA